MHLLKFVMGAHGLADTSALLEQEGGYEEGDTTSVNKSALVTGSPFGVIGGVRGWSGASSVVKHQQSYRPSTRSSSSFSRFADNNKLLSVFTVIGLILIFSNFTKMSGVSAMPRCPPGGVESEEPVDCSYGISTDYCGRKVCAKGPGQICGVGLFKLLGSCGEGLYCNCGRCTGCSLLTMECYDKTCV